LVSMGVSGCILRVPRTVGYYRC